MEATAGKFHGAISRVCYGWEAILPREEEIGYNSVGIPIQIKCAAIRAKIPIREGSPSVRQKHVEHFIGTLEDRDMAKQMMVVRLEGVDDMKETLHRYQRIGSRQFQSAMGSSKFRQRPTSASTPTPSKPTRAVRAIHVESGSSDSDSDRVGSEV